jgi:tRNA-2-methylthio-N6-dimethylallyladenosine synthase
MTKPTKKKLYIKTYGCQMNSYDSERMADVMLPHGYHLSDSPDNADMVLLNTCHIREKASEKLYSDLGRLRLIKDRRALEGKTMLIGVAGCVAQADGEEMIARAPYVDVVVGPQSYHHLPKLVADALETGKSRIELEFEEEVKFDNLPNDTEREGPSAYVSVQEGCDKFCTFCVVPYTRGAEFSRSVEAILQEVHRAVDRGAFEITLLGQNVNAYHGLGPDGKEWHLAQLIEQVAKISAVKRIRYTTSHPRDMDANLIRAHGDIPSLMPFLHLPVQSGSDRILKAMNRKHTADHYIRIIHDLRAARPDIALSSDFIVGFPGESDADFEATMRLTEMVGFAQAYSFKYSQRPGTPAAEHEVQVPRALKEERLAALQGLINQQQLAFNQKMIGDKMSVLLDRTGKFAGQLKGRSAYMQSVHVDNAVEYRHQLIDVRITGAYANSLSGEIITAKMVNQQGETPYDKDRQEIRA